MRAMKSALSPGKPNAAAALPPVSMSENREVRYLHLGSEWVQGSMRIAKPYEIELEYLQRMMVWLLFVDADSVAQRHAMQLGLGSGALTKFCHKKLHMKTSAIELNPQVVNICRGWFKLPPDDERLLVVNADAEVEVRNPVWAGTVDALQVDLYDHEAAAPVLDSEQFYSDCRRLLTPDGLMTVNLFGRTSSFERSLHHMAATFGERALWAFRPTREGNTIVLAQRKPALLLRPELAERADIVQTRWGLPAAKWLRVFKPYPIVFNP